jgi:hypothetical protein
VILDHLSFAPTLFVIAGLDLASNPVSKKMDPRTWVYPNSAPKMRKSSKLDLRGSSPAGDEEWGAFKLIGICSKDQLSCIARASGLLRTRISTVWNSITGNSTASFRAAGGRIARRRSEG